MSLRLAISSSLTSSSTPATTPATPHANASSSFHVFQTTTSPPLVLGNGTYTISRRASEAPSTPLIPSSSVSVADAGENGTAGADLVSNGAIAVADANKPRATVNVEAMVAEARRRGMQKGRREDEIESMAQTAARCAQRIFAMCPE